jgi:LacI family transcriptional regulator
MHGLCICQLLSPMNFETITIRDIARKLNLSVSTVSKALSDSYEISEKTKRLVIEYSREHNYYPNPLAQSLKRGRSKSIGIVVSTIDNHFFSQVINGIESVAYSNDYNVIITQTHESNEREIKNINHLIHHAIDGLLISLSTETYETEYLKKLQQQGLHIVFFDRVSNEIDTHKVIADNFKGGYEATSHLLQSGFNKIAHITSSANTSITGERLAGYKKAMDDNNIAINEQYIKYCPHGGKQVDEIENALNELLALDERPNAIFTASDRITTTTLSLLHKLNVKIPNEIALIGFTNTALAEVLNPPLSAIYQPGFEMGKTATELLLGLIKSKHPINDFETRVLPTQLFQRASTCKVF